MTGRSKPCLVHLCAPFSKARPLGRKESLVVQRSPGPGTCPACKLGPRVPTPLSPPARCGSGTQGEASGPASADGGGCLLISPGTPRLLQTSLVDSVGRRKGWGGQGVARGKVLQEPAPFLPSPSLLHWCAFSSSLPPSLFFLITLAFCSQFLSLWSFLFPRDAH